MATEGTSLLDPPPILTIETERLQLTTLQMSDLDDLEPIYGDDEVMVWTTTGTITSRSQAEQWLSARCLGPDVFNFAVRLRADVAAAAAAAAEASSPSSRAPIIGILGSFHIPTCGYLFRADYHGKGYATEALKAFTPAFFAHVPRAKPSTTGTETAKTAATGDAAVAAAAAAAEEVDGSGSSSNSSTPGVDYLEAWTDEANTGSQRVLAKAGFRRGQLFVDGYTVPMLGLRSSVVFHLARPGMTLEEVGIGPDAVLDSRPLEEREEGVVPPVQ